jgi:two-component system sensor histidine kinase KdpD
MMTEDRADTFLRLIRRAERGRLKVYLGYCAGVGKTYQMLLEAHRLRGEGIDVAVGLVETHGRPETAKLVEGLDVIPRRRQDYRGIVVEEMDVEAILRRRPQVVLVDELAHTNVPGSSNAKRYQDVQDILAAGIHVISTLNVQHIESLYDTVERAVGVKVRERLPDAVLAEADQIVNVDLTTEDLRRRLQEGKVYTPERIDVALTHFFRTSNLEQLRELTLRELASQIDLKRRGTETEDVSATPDQVMACLSSKGPNSESLIRYASRLAGRLNRNWYAVYVQTPSEEPTVIDAHTQRILAGTLTLAKQLGAMVFTYKGQDVVRTILQFAREYRVGHIVLGRPRRRSPWQRLVKGETIGERLIHEARGMTLVVIDTQGEGAFAIEAESETGQDEARIGGAGQLRLSHLLSLRRVVLWDRPVDKAEVLRALVEATAGSGVGDPRDILDIVLKREEQGSTFFNEGVAFPHARIDTLTTPLVAVGFPRWGLTDVQTEKPIEIVFLILSPGRAPEIQVQILGLLSRVSRDRSLLQSLHGCGTSDEAMAVLLDWERGRASGRAGEEPAA